MQLPGARLVLFFALVGLALGCDQMRQGCRIENMQCVCGTGCYTDYRYTTKDECRRALKGRRRDICQRNPCYNGGACSQSTLDPGFRCRCEGTGFYGDRCQSDCSSVDASLVSYPYECVII